MHVPSEAEHDLAARRSGRSDGAVREDERRIADAVELARAFVERSAVLDRRAGLGERRRRRRLAALIADPEAADFTVRLTDEVARLSDVRRAAERFARLVGEADLSGLPTPDRVMLVAARAIAPVLPRVVMPLVQRRLRVEARGAILPAEDPAFGRRLAAHASAGIRSNVNVLGEAIVGDGEARRRLDQVLARLDRSDVQYVSVKISAVCASIDVLAFDDTVEQVADRLRPLYRRARSFDPPKFVNLDMEEYHDLDLTIAVCRRILDEDEFVALDAGIVLQAYLPDAQRAATELADWAAARRQRAGGRLKIRLVKGANLAMEQASAELAGWPSAPYDTKADTDANYKAVLDLLLRSDYDDAVIVGVASHNLFEIAWAIGRRDELMAAGRPDRITFEMLEGMAASQAHAVREVAGDLLLYSPVVERSDFAAAIAYLVRRLDENTTPENFLAQLFRLAAEPELFAAEAERFASAVRRRREVEPATRRTQDRSLPTMPPTDGFVNAPDTDWSRPANRAWVSRALGAGVVDVALDGAERVDVSAVDRAMVGARRAQSRWQALGGHERARIVQCVGDELEARRGVALAVMADEAGKTVAQGDPEVSEAVDFARYYGRDAARLATVEGASSTGRGVVVIAPPWNFPLAIPAGGVLAALAAGNAVVLKPAPQTRRTARLVAEACWAAGVPTDVLQYVAADDDAAGRRLVTHPDVAAVVLTGAFDTAQLFHRWRPDLRVHAETSGKNALVVSASADVDEAVADLVTSAFGHAGQKCSAASLAIVEAPLYDDPKFLERLRDAAATLRVGDAADLTTDVGPLIEPPGERLLRALTELEPGERWLLEPRCLTGDRRSWTPGIRLGVRPGSWFARTECFGPVLGVVRADDLDHAVAIQNDTDFGLTAGLHSLDPDEIARWLELVDAGNLYVNRGITGAIVQRQPFGGWKRSVVGPTAKAGGPNYVATLARWDDDPATSIDDVRRGFHEWWTTVGSQQHDPTGLRCERNVFRYRSLPGGVLVRYGADATDRQRSLVEAAAAVTGCRLVESAPDEPIEALVARLPQLDVDRCRLIGDVLDPDDRLTRACHTAHVAVDDAPPVGAARIELPRWLREQSISITNHRHGRVDLRGETATSVLR